MSEHAGDKERDAATGAAIGVATRRGLFGGGAGGSGGLGTGIGRPGRDSSDGGGSGVLTVIVVIAVLLGTLAIMFYVNS